MLLLFIYNTSLFFILLIPRVRLSVWHKADIEQIFEECIIKVCPKRVIDRGHRNALLGLW